MYQETAVLIKEEEIVESPEDPLNGGDPSFHVKQEHELMHHVNGSEINECTLVTMYQEAAMLIKKEEIVEAPDEPDSTSLQDPLYIGEPSLHVKEERELKHHEDGFEHNALKDPLQLGAPSFHVKQEHEFKHDWDASEHNVAASTGSESDSTRLIQQSSESCYISSDEIVTQEVDPSELEISAGESNSFTVFGMHTQHTEEQEQEHSFFGISQKCSLREKEFHKFRCSFCLQSFPSKFRLIMHVFIHIDGVQPPKYVCKSCGKVFCSNFSLNRHVKMTAGVRAPFDGHNHKIGHIYYHENIVEGDKISSTDQTDKQSSNKETRGISRKFYDNYNTLILTRDGAKRVRHDNYGGSSISDNVNHHAVTHTYKCDMCGKAFTRLGHLKRHGLIHAAIRTHTCNICGKSFTRLDHLKKHSLKHTGLKPHKCDRCGKSFTWLCNLKQHSLIHTRSAVHKCDICDKSFIQGSDLKTHLLIHTASKVHKCDICDKPFTHLGHLNRHYLIHTGAKPHKCDICGKYFTQLSNLKQHSLIHTESKSHKCDICGKSYTVLSSLKRHSLIHTGPKPNKCDVCGKSFTWLGALEQHLLIHTVIKTAQM